VAGSVLVSLEGRRLLTELSHLSVAMGYEVNELQDVISNKLEIVLTRELTSSKCVGMMGDIMELLLPAKLHVQKLF
jgi:hypothetical protein